eukprot:474550_1
MSSHQNTQKHTNTHSINRQKNTTKNNIDFSIFDYKTSNNNECNGYQSCNHLQRAYVGMKHYKLLCEKDNKNIGPTLFIPFCKDTYKRFLDDYNHIVKTHQNDIKLIANELMENYGFKHCNVGKCFPLQRHYSR